IITKNIDKAIDVMQRLSKDLKDIEVDDSALTLISKVEEASLMKCITAGQIDQLWTVNDQAEAVHISSQVVRELSSTTVVRNPALIAGTPFDLQVAARDGSLKTLHLVQGITMVNVDWLIELAPEQFAAKRGKMAYDPRTGGLVIRQQVRAGKKVL